MSNHLDLSLYKVSSVGTTVDCMDKVDVHMEYTWLGWFFITWFGTTQMPIKIIFTCKETGEVFEDISDKKRIQHYMLYRKK